MAATPIPPDRKHPLLILAMDHRDSFAKLFGLGDALPTDSQLTAMRFTKGLIYQGLLRARSALGQATAGVLVDEHLGADILRQARGSGVAVAMPVEKSGQKKFALEYGAETDRHLADFDPDYVKVLVRMNPADDPVDLKAQLVALARLSSSLNALGRAFLYELLVPPTDEQLTDAGSQERFDEDMRPDLVCEVIAANQQAGVEPTLWKIEGLETRAAAESVVAAAHAGGRQANCIVLGRDAPREKLDSWLSIASAVDGFVGFAVGRSIWEEAVEIHVRDGDDQALVGRVADNYLHFAGVYVG